jgi:hypothetical protein
VVLSFTSATFSFVDVILAVSLHLSGGNVTTPTEETWITRLSILASVIWFSLFANEFILFISDAVSGRLANTCDGLNKLIWNPEAYTKCFKRTIKVFDNLNNFYKLTLVYISYDIEKNNFDRKML